jgi:hypothetical protein
VLVLGGLSLAVLAGAVVRWPRRPTFAVAGVVGLTATVLDGRELLHQLDEDATTVAVLAGLTLALHLAAAGVAAHASTTTTRPLPLATS